MGSPPKRMTRARAKAVDTHEPASAPDTPMVAKIMTPAAKAAATRRAKKDTQTRAAAEADEEDELLAEAANNATMNSTATAPPPETATKSAAKPRGRPAKAKAVAQDVEEEVAPATPAPVKRTRGRPRKTPVAEETAAEPESVPIHVTRPASATIAVPPRRPTAYRKKVSFQEEANKENASVEVSKKVTEATAETGIRAKPTRRAGAARGAAAQATPKKRTEVAETTHSVVEAIPAAAAPKLVSVSGRDELDDAEEDVAEAPKGLSSPTKNVKDIVAPSPPKITAPSPAKPSVLGPKPSTSPMKLFGASLLGSPAKRPPQSPFKHAMRDSPLKASGASMLLGADSRTPLQVSMMSKSPRRFPFSTVERKANVHVLPATTDLKRSLFASPPKRPLSPTKQPLSKKGLSLMSAMTSTAHAARKPSVTHTPTRMVATSAFASHKSPAASAKVHKMTPEERDEMMKLELATAPSPFTPWLGRNKTPKEHQAMYRNELRTAPTPFTPGSARPHMTRVTSSGSVSGTPATFSRQNSNLDAEQRLATMSEAQVETQAHSSLTPKNDRFVLAHSTTPEGLPSVDVIQAITPVRDTSYRNTNDDSDDELSLSASKLTITSKHKYEQTTPARGPVTPSSYRNATVSSHNKAGSITTLANKFGNWKTATPDQKVIDQRKHEKAVFSVADARRQSMPATPSSAHPTQTPRSQQRGQMTALAQKFGDWTGATPDAKVLEQRNGQKSALLPMKRSASFALRTPQVLKNAQTPRTVKAPMTVAADWFKLPVASNGDPIVEPHPEDFAQFEEAMAILEDSNDMDFHDYSMHRTSNAFRASQMSDASQVYGDENAMPMDDNDFDMLAPAYQQIKVITPARLQTQQPRVVHTVTKVPLKPAASDNESPLLHHGRSQSLAGPLSPQAARDIRALREIPVHFDSSPLVAHSRHAVPAIVATPHTPQQTPRPQMQSLEAPTPIRTPRADLKPGLLSAAVVYVDVHTTEGADASGIFIELLMQMGARCVKQWSWNPQGAGDEDTTDKHKRVGITHVVFKDGGKRTMEKVRQAKGLVSCVGVAWVLEYVVSESRLLYVMRLTSVQLRAREQMAG